MSHQTIIAKLQKIIDKTSTDLQKLDSQAVVTGDMQGDFERLLKQEFYKGYIKSIMDISEIVVNDYNQLNNQTSKVGS
jgi:hypothetical protein